MNAIGFDCTMLSILLNPKSRVPTVLGTQTPIDFAKQRAEGFIRSVEKARRKIILPTPACSELLTAIGPDAQQYLNLVARSRLFEIAAFDARCASELAILNRGVFRDADDRNGAEPYQKRKVDRQIIAICKVAGVTEIHSTDSNLCNLARLCSIEPVRLEDLPIPADDRQMKMFELEPHEDLPEPENEHAPAESA